MHRRREAEQVKGGAGGKTVDDLLILGATGRKARAKGQKTLALRTTSASLLTFVVFHHVRE